MKGYSQCVLRLLPALAATFLVSGCWWDKEGNPIFSIGGAVTGLSGTGLVLQNNGGDDRAVAASGPFTFATQLKQGSVYSVAVKAQPTSPAQTCVVANGSGTVGIVDVTSVSVSCTTNAPSTFSVGGTVSGMTGSGLVLQVNGGNDLAIASNATFAFTTPINSGSTYSVSVKTQPTSPSQTCTVSNGSGTIGGASVTNVSVACATTPMTITSSTPANNESGVSTSVHPVVVFSTALNAATVTPANITLQSATGGVAISLTVSGNQVTVTPATALSSPVLYTLTITAGVRGSLGEQLAGAATTQFTTVGNGWANAAAIEYGGSYGISTPRIGFDGAGTALMIWTQYSQGHPNNIFAKRFNGSVWGPAAAIESASVGSADNVQLAVSPNGSAVAVWVASDGTRTNVWSNHYSASGGWGTAELIETDNAGDVRTPQVAIDPNGNAFAVWVQEDNTYHDPGVPGHPNIWANHYTAGSGWGTATLIEGDIGTVGAPQIAVSASGNAVAVWNQGDGGLIAHVMANHFIAGGGWGAAEIVGNNATDGSVQGEYAPQIAIDANGNAIAVWMGQYTSSRKFIWANRFTPGGGWGTATAIETNSALDTVYPKIAIDSAGNALAMWWQRTDSTHANIVANRYSIANGWGTAVPIDPGVGSQIGSLTDHQIAMNTNGTAVAVWQEFDGTRSNLWSNRYTPAGGWSTPQLIETNNLGDAEQQQVAVDHDGTALAVWRQSDGTSDPVWANWFQQFSL